MEYIVIPERTWKYDVSHYDFSSVILSAFQDASSLDSLHKIVPKSHELNELVGVNDDNRTWLHSRFYDKLNAGWPELISLYDEFIHSVVKKSIKEDDFLRNHSNAYAYQRFPTFRVQVPGNLSVGEFHKDSDYNHPAGEINFVVPLTDANDTASIWCESNPELGDFHPLKMKVGNLIMFDGNMCNHGNKVNTMNYCRVSFDFRLLPIKYHKSEYSLSSVDLDKKFVIGDYYSDKVLKIS